MEPLKQNSLKKTRDRRKAWYNFLPFSRPTEQLVNLTVQVVLFLFVLCIYVYNCAPTIFISSEFTLGRSLNGDSLSLLNQIEYKSTSYPATSPLWFILTRIMRHIPFGEFPYHLNLMSAFFGALSVLFLYKIVSGYRHNRHPDERSRASDPLLSRIFPAIVISLLFAFSYPFWLLSEFGAPDTLQVLLLLMVLYFLLTAFRTRIFRYFYYTIIALALGISVYPVITVISPFILILILIKALEIRGLSSLPVFIVIYICGFLMHLYHPINYLLQNQGEYQQYGNFLWVAVAVIKGQIQFLRWLVSFKTVYLLILVYLPILQVSIRRASALTPNRVANVMRIAINYIILLIGILLMLNVDRRIANPVSVDIMMYNSLNPFPYVIISLWLGYLFGYVMHMVSGKKVPEGTNISVTGVKGVRIFAVASLVILLIALPVANIWMNKGYAKTSREIWKPYIQVTEQVEGIDKDTVEVTDKEIPHGSLINWSTNKGICRSSLRDFRRHEQAGIIILEKIREMRYEPGSAAIAADVVITNVSSFASLLQHTRGHGNILFKHVVIISSFENEEWYYNRMMKHAFRIDPEASWEIGKYSTADVTYQALINHEGFTVILVYSGIVTSLSGHIEDEFSQVQTEWYSTRDVDSLVNLARRFILTNKPDKADNLYILILKTNPENHLVQVEINNRINQYVQSNQIQNARNFIGQIVKYEPEYIYLQKILDGIIYQSMIPPETDKAIQSFRESVGINPNFNAFNNLAALLYLKGEYREAYKCAKQALELLGESAPPVDRASVLDKVGWLAFKLGQAGDKDKEDEASELLKEAYDLYNLIPKSRPEVGGYILLHYGGLLYSSHDQAVRNEGYSIITSAIKILPALTGEADKIMEEADKMKREKESE